MSMMLPTHTATATDPTGHPHMEPAMPTAISAAAAAELTGNKQIASDGTVSAVSDWS